MTAKSRHTRTLFALLSPVLLAGCAMPVPVTIASFFLDGVSIAATNKTVTDHGLSFVAQKDCAVWRGFTEGELCREDSADGDVMLALNDEATSAEDDIGLETASDAGETLRAVEDTAVEVSADPPPLAPAKVETAPLPPLKGQPVSRPEVVTSWYAPNESDPTGSNAPQALPPLPPQAPDVPEIPVPGSETVLEPDATEETRVARDPAEWPVAAEPTPRPIPSALVVPATTMKPDIKPATAPAPVKKAPAGAVKPNSGGFHYVIASFAKTGYAERLIRKNVRLGAHVAEAKIGAKTYYRVVVGPLAPKERKSTRRRLTKTGFRDAWGVRIATPAPTVEVAAAN